MSDAPEQNPYATPIMPVKLSLDDTIQFNCHKGIACFNKCCQQIDLTLAPYDIVRLKNRLGIEHAGISRAIHRALRHWMVRKCPASRCAPRTRPPSARC